MIPITPENFPHGITCGCDCGCPVPLSDGNCMTEDITHEGRDPWELPDPDEIPVFLAICIDCYTGLHAAKP